MIRFSFILGFGACLFAGSAFGAEMPPEGRLCLSPAETREAILDNKLADPMSALRTAAAHARAEALRSRLCRWNEDFVYEITLLRRDGKVLHVFIKATDGSVVNARPNP